MLEGVLNLDINGMRKIVNLGQDNLLKKQI